MLRDIKTQKKIDWRERQGNRKDLFTVLDALKLYEREIVFNEYVCDFCFMRRVIYSRR